MERIELSQVEKALLEKGLAKFEKDARRSRGMNFFLAGLVCILFVLGFEGISHVLKTLYTPFDQQAFIESLGCEEIPEDVPFKYWIVGYVNKVAVISEHDRRIGTVEQLEASLGLVFIATGILGFVFLVNHWNDGKRNLVIAKVLRQHLGDCGKED